MPGQGLVLRGGVEARVGVGSVATLATAAAFAAVGVTTDGAFPPIGIECPCAWTSNWSRTFAAGRVGPDAWNSAVQSPAVGKVTSSAYRPR